MSCNCQNEHNLSELLELYWGAPVNHLVFLSFSDEDTDIKALVEAWLKSVTSSGDSATLQLRDWINDYFHRALKWVMGKELIVETTIVGMTMNGLSHLVGAATKEEFLCGLIRGLGSNISPENQAELSNEVFQWSMHSHPDPRKPMDTYYDSSRNMFSSYHLKV